MYIIGRQIHGRFSHTKENESAKRVNLVYRWVNHDGKGKKPGSTKKL